MSSGVEPSSLALSLSRWTTARKSPQPFPLDIGYRGSKRPWWGLCLILEMSSRHKGLGTRVCGPACRADRKGNFGRGAAKNSAWPSPQGADTSCGEKP